MAINNVSIRIYDITIGEISLNNALKSFGPYGLCSHLLNVLAFSPLIERVDAHKVKV